MSWVRAPHELPQGLGDALEEADPLDGQNQGMSRRIPGLGRKTERKTNDTEQYHWQRSGNSPAR